jgi:diacylglycerol O-acyltransferase / wax synthase
MDAMAQDHLSSTDTFTLQLERDPVLRSTIVAVATFDRAPDWSSLVDRIDRATRLAPRFRMVLRPSPLGMAPPRWIVDPDFDLGWHLRRARIHRGGGRAAVLQFARNAGMTAFDHERALWEFTLLDGLPGQRSALVMKVHHALTDGIGGIQIAAHVVDLEREPSAQGPMPAAPAPDGTGMLADLFEPIGYHLGRTLETGRRLGRHLPGMVADAAMHPVSALGDAVGAGLAVAHFVRPVTTTRSPVMTGRSLRWNYEELDVPFRPLREAARAVDCSLNDAFMAGVTGGLRRYHELHAAAVDELRASMPISVRLPDDPEGGNRVTVTRFDVPVQIVNAGIRMVEISRRTQELRTDPAIAFSDRIAMALNMLPVSVTGGMLKHVDFLASNVPGFPHAVYVGGARLESFHPFGPTLGSAANITLMSYDGSCHMGINTDEGAVSDPRAFLECLAEGFDEVLAVGR